MSDSLLPDGPPDPLTVECSTCGAGIAINCAGRISHRARIAAAQLAAFRASQAAERHAQTLRGVADCRAALGSKE